jgi:hypothetical protein
MVKISGMKSNLTGAVALAFAAFFSGCTSFGSAPVLAPVGPAPVSVAAPADHGTLVVYSAFKTGLPNPNLPDDIRQHSSYELRSETGTWLRAVANEQGFQGEDPAPVELPPGNYRVVARANGYGLVTVPVVIAASRVTTVHLEGGASFASQGASSLGDSVRLPDGGVVGWKATAENPPSSGSR